MHVFVRDFGDNMYDLWCFHSKLRLSRVRFDFVVVVISVVAVVIARNTSMFLAGLYRFVSACFLAAFYDELCENAVSF